MHASASMGEHSLRPENNIFLSTATLQSATVWASRAGSPGGKIAPRRRQRCHRPSAARATLADGADTRLDGANLCFTRDKFQTKSVKDVGRRTIKFINSVRRSSTVEAVYSQWSSVKFCGQHPPTLLPAELPWGPHVCQMALPSHGQEHHRVGPKVASRPNISPEWAQCFGPTLV